MNDPSLKPVRVALEGVGLEIQVDPRVSLFDSLRASGMAIDSDCGGRGTCGECRVRFLAGADPPTLEEEALLTAEELAGGWRLACQSYLAADCRLLLPAVAAPRRRGTLRVLTEATASAPWRRPGGHRATATGYGVAVDVGTTTVVCYLTDTARALQLGVAAFANPQRTFGPDVISRIMYAHRGEAELRELQGSLVEAVEERAVQLCAAHGLEPDALTAMTFAGNMTMLHLLRGVDPWSLGVAPYRPAFTESPPLSGRDLGFRRLAQCAVHVLPGIGGHLGSDVVAGMVALALPRPGGVSLFLDLGTNGEAVLCSDHAAVGSSCAAGPAFEGVHIQCGMAAFPGAIERVDEEDGRLRLDTIDDGGAVGLCGSGLVDAVALLLRHGLLLPSGRLAPPDRAPADAPEDLRRRLREGERGRRFVLCENGGAGEVALTQQDVREVQLAKAPIRAGIEVLLREAGFTADAIDDVFVAGAFGSSLRAESLLALGLLPPAVRGRIHAAGNTAGLGARLALTYPDRLAEAERLARSVRHVDLVLRQDFRDAFAEHVPFPPPAAC